jgi:hypothetical protein
MRSEPRPTKGGLSSAPKLRTSSHKFTSVCASKSMKIETPAVGMNYLPRVWVIFRRPRLGALCLMVGVRLRGESLSRAKLPERSRNLSRREGAGRAGGIKCCQMLSLHFDIHFLSTGRIDHNIMRRRLRERRLKKKKKGFLVTSSPVV